MALSLGWHDIHDGNISILRCPTLFARQPPRLSFLNVSGFLARFLSRRLVEGAIPVRAILVCKVEVGKINACKRSCPPIAALHTPCHHSDDMLRGSMWCYLGVDY